MAAYGFFVQKTAFKPLSQTSNLPFGDISGMIAKPVQVAFKNHYQKTSVRQYGFDRTLNLAICCLIYHCYFITSLCII
jgi:hypothetical protein